MRHPAPNLQRVSESQIWVCLVCGGPRTWRQIYRCSHFRAQRKKKRRTQIKCWYVLMVGPFCPVSAENGDGRTLSNPGTFEAPARTQASAHVSCPVEVCKPKGNRISTNKSANVCPDRPASLSGDIVAETAASQIRFEVLSVILSRVIKFTSRFP